MVQDELKDIYEDSVIYFRYPGVPWGTLRYFAVMKYFHVLKYFQT